MIRFSKDRLRIATSLVQPFLFLFVLGTGLSRLASAGTHGVNLRTFVYPGVLCMAVLFTAMFSAASLVWDREFGFLREMMVAPVRRSSLVLGKCFGGATVAAFQGLIVICLAGLVGVPYAPVLLLEMFALQLLLAFSITAFGVMVAARIARCSRSWPDADGDHADVLPLRARSSRSQACRSGCDPQPDRPADLRRRPDAPRGLQPPAHQQPRPPRARPRRDLVGLARAGPARGRRRRDPRTRDARDRDLEFSARE
jgi:hypothetical protein